jgi:hypothetical protein
MTEPGVIGRGRARRATVPEPELELTPEERMAELDQRLARLEGSPGLRERGRSMLDRVMPPEAGTHFRNAGREQLLGIRSIVDFWIRRLEESETRAGQGRSRERETIEIE